jgi:hypothetical protein
MAVVLHSRSLTPGQILDDGPPAERGQAQALAPRQASDARQQLWRERNLQTLSFVHCNLLRKSYTKIF